MVQGYSFIIAAACCWGLIGIFSSVAFAQGVAPLEVAFWRAVLTWFCFGSRAALRKETRVARKDLPLLLVFGILGIAAFYVSYQYAVKTGGAAFASVLLYTAPAWVLVCSFFIYRERLGRAKIVAVVMVIGGVYLISRDGGDVGGHRAIGMVAIGAGLAAGFCYSLYYTIGKYFSARYSSANLFLYVLPVGAVCIFPLVDFAPKNATAWAALFAVAVLSTFIANYCYYQGLRYLGAGRASIVATIEPVVAAVAAYVILDEYFSVLGYAGAALIVLAVVVTVRARE